MRFWGSNNVISLSLRFLMLRIFRCGSHCSPIFVGESTFQEIFESVDAS
jgi:hypothetical protein